MNENYGERLCIEQGRPEDAEELIALLRQVGSETDNLTFGAEGPAFTLEQEQEYLRAMAENPTSAFFVARLDGRMVGSLSFRAMTLARASHRAEMGISVLQGRGQPVDGGRHRLCKEHRRGRNHLAGGAGGQHPRPGALPQIRL